MAPHTNTKKNQKSWCLMLLPEPKKWYLSVIGFYFSTALHFIHIYSCRTEVRRYWGCHGSGRKAVIHKNAPHLHCRTLNNWTICNCALFFFFNNKKILWLEFNLLIFPPSYPWIFLCHRNVKEGPSQDPWRYRGFGDSKRQATFMGRGRGSRASL